MRWSNSLTGSREIESPTEIKIPSMPKICMFVHRMNEIKNCQKTFEISGQLIGWTADMNVKISTDQEFVIIWEYVCQKPRKCINKILIIFRRASMKSTSNNCSSKVEYDVVERRHLKLLKTQASLPPWPDVRGELTTEQPGEQNTAGEVQHTPVYLYHHQQKDTGLCALCMFPSVQQ